MLIARSLLVSAFILAPSLMAAEDANTRAREFIKAQESIVRPLEKSASLAWWNANISGKDEDFKAKEEAQNKLDAALGDRTRFAQLKEIEAAHPKDKMLARQIHLLYLAALEKQVDAELLKKMTAKGNAIEQAFNVFRTKVGDREITDSQVDKVLKESKDSAERRAIWEGSKAVGAKVEKDLHELVLLRNQAARELGFEDYHVLQLFLNEQNQT